jgi:hypothetical protein
LKLLCRTVRESRLCAEAVRILKIPYLTRNNLIPLLARTVSVLPNLEYVDLPEGFFNDEPQYNVLRQELQARCAHIRKMTYNEGSEQWLEYLLQGHWQELRVLELSKLNVETTLARQIFGGLPDLKHLTLANFSWYGDELFSIEPGLPALPFLTTLTLKDMPHVSQQALTYYLMRSDSVETLQIKDCESLPVTSLRQILSAGGSRLQYLGYSATVSKMLVVNQLHPLASNFLRVLVYEIVSSDSTIKSLYPPAPSYYEYLKHSLFAGTLPRLRELYVRDVNFAEKLTPPIVPFASATQQQERPHGLTQAIDVFAKLLEEHEWMHTFVCPPELHRPRDSIFGSRPASSYSAGTSSGSLWAGQSRNSMIVGDGFGKYLAAPMPRVDRPMSAGNAANDSKAAWLNERKAKRSHATQADLWR